MAERIAGVYLSRNPKASPLYGLFEDYFDEFERVYEDRFAEKHGFLRPVVRKVADRFLDCGDLRHGFARICGENPDCRHEMILAFSCRGRNFCPSCHAKRVAAFADWLGTEVLAEVPHRQYVFTVPKLIRPHFRFDRTPASLFSMATRFCPTIPLPLKDWPSMSLALRYPSTAYSMMDPTERSITVPSPRPATPCSTTMLRTRSPWKPWLHFAILFRIRVNNSPVTLAGTQILPRRSDRSM